MESRTLRIFGNFGLREFKKRIQNFMNFWKLGIREFNKMNSELCEFLETWCTGIFKNESKILLFFGILGMGI